MYRRRPSRPNSLMARLICASWTRSVDDTDHLLRGRAGVVARFTGLRPPAQEPLAVEVGIAARHGPGVVLVLVELQREERFARGLAHVVLDVRVRPALEVGNVDAVQVREVAHIGRRLQDLAPVVPAVSYTHLRAHETRHD